MRSFGLSISLLFYFSSSTAQSVGIGTSTPHTSAAVEINSNNKGFLPPRTTRLSIINPVDGLVIFDTERSSFYYYSGGDWKKIVEFNELNWYKNGVNIYNANTNGGNIGIGTTDPQSRLHIGDATSPNELIIGRNKSSGGYTAMYLGNSSLSNGYNYIQSVKSAGSQYGNLLLNPNGGTVGISTISPQESAALDVQSNNKGILFPRMTTAQRNSIVNPADGLHIYNTDINSLESYDSSFSIWETYCNTCDVHIDTIPINVTTWVVNASYKKYKLVIPPGIVVSGANALIGTGTDPAILLNLPVGSSVVIENHGGIYGVGGKGGQGGGNSASNGNITCSPDPPEMGRQGGDAIEAKVDVQVRIENYGIIAGGGGGGGGGNYGSSTSSAGGGGGAGQGVPQVGGAKGVNRFPQLNIAWTCAIGVNNSTVGGTSSLIAPGNPGSGSTGPGGGFNGGQGGSLGSAGQPGVGNPGSGGLPGKAVRGTPGKINLVNLTGGQVYGLVD